MRTAVMLATIVVCKPTAAHEWTTFVEPTLGTRLEQRRKIYYSRCNFSRSSNTIHCFDLKYPAHEKRAWDDVVTRISRSLASSQRG
jgi:hypothetical protein